MSRSQRHSLGGRNETRIIGCSIDLDEIPEIEHDDLDSYPTGDGRLRAPNGAATMKYDGEYQLLPMRRGYRREEDVILDVHHPTINGEIELSPIEAVRLGIALIAHGEAEYEENGGGN